MEYRTDTQFCEIIYNMTSGNWITAAQLYCEGEFDSVTLKKFYQDYELIGVMPSNLSAWDFVTLTELAYKDYKY